MSYLLPYLCLLFALPVLTALTIIDLKIRILPNKLVATFALLGFAFHMNTKFLFCTPQDMILGAFIGGGLLYLVRMTANKYYKRDTLGLGDVKLMTAAGLWLGIDHILPALSLGALIGVVHGLGYAATEKKRTGNTINLHNLSIPAGPGFIAGVVILALVKFQSLPDAFPPF